MQCPLCQIDNTNPYHSDRSRDFLCCGRCHLVFVDPTQRLGLDAERAEYDKHQNSPDDSGYRRFLGRVVVPLQEYLADEALGLDFGCGPGPTLSVMMAEAGWKMDLYDPYYYPNQNIFERRYDFITATEVVEHLFEPRAVLERLWKMLNPGGTLALMTKLVIGQEAFQNWHYKNDPTHVCFFSEQSFRYLAVELGGDLKFFGKDVIFMSKPFIR